MSNLFDVAYEIQNFVLNEGAVEGAMERAEARAMRSVGAYIRTVARNSIRRRKAVSQPGDAPSRHSSGGLRAIAFDYSPGQRDVVIGPTMTGSKIDGRTVPNLLEFGGVVSHGRRGERAERRRYAPRPFMGPALQKSLQQNIMRRAWLQALS